jgi:hypothetical protein
VVGKRPEATRSPAFVFLLGKAIGRVANRPQAAVLGIADVAATPENTPAGGVDHRKSVDEGEVPLRGSARNGTAV